MINTIKRTIIFKIISLAVVCLFLFNEWSFALSPNSRFKPVSDIKYSDGKVSLVEDNSGEPQFIREEFVSRVGFLQINRIISLVLENQLIDKGILSAKGLSLLIDGYFKETLQDYPEEYEELKDIFGWDDLKIRDDNILVPYKNRKMGIDDILVFSFRDGKLLMDREYPVPPREEYNTPTSFNELVRALETLDAGKTITLNEDMTKTVFRWLGLDGKIEYFPEKVDVIKTSYIDFLEFHIFPPKHPEDGSIMTGSQLQKFSSSYPAQLFRERLGANGVETAPSVVAFDGTSIFNTSSADSFLGLIRRLVAEHGDHHTLSSGPEMSLGMLSSAVINDLGEVGPNEELSFSPGEKMDPYEVLSFRFEPGSKGRGFFNDLFALVGDEKPEILFTGARFQGDDRIFPHAFILKDIKNRKIFYLHIMELAGAEEAAGADVMHRVDYRKSYRDLDQELKRIFRGYQVDGAMIRVKDVHVDGTNMRSLPAKIMYLTQPPVERVPVYNLFGNRRWTEIWPDTDEYDTDILMNPDDPSHLDFKDVLLRYCLRGKFRDKKVGIVGTGQGGDIIQVLSGRPSKVTANDISLPAVIVSGWNVHIAKSMGVVPEDIPVEIYHDSGLGSLGDCDRIIWNTPSIMHDSSMKEEDGGPSRNPIVDQTMLIFPIKYPYFKTFLSSLSLALSGHDAFSLLRLALDPDLFIGLEERDDARKRILEEAGVRAVPAGEDINGNVDIWEVRPANRVENSDIGGDGADNATVVNPVIKEKIKSGKVIKYRMDLGQFYRPVYVENDDERVRNYQDMGQVLDHGPFTEEEIERLKDYLARSGLLKELPLSGEDKDVAVSDIMIGIIEGETFVNPDDESHFSLVHTGKSTTTIWFGEEFLRYLLLPGLEVQALRVLTHEVKHLTDPDEAEAEHASGSYLTLRQSLRTEAEWLDAVTWTKMFFDYGPSGAVLKKTEKASIVKDEEARIKIPDGFAQDREVVLFNFEDASGKLHSLIAGRDKIDHINEMIRKRYFPGLPMHVVQRTYAGRQDVRKICLRNKILKVRKGNISVPLSDIEVLDRGEVPYIYRADGYIEVWPESTVMSFPQTFMPAAPKRYSDRYDDLSGPALALTLDPDTGEWQQFAFNEAQHEVINAALKKLRAGNIAKRGSEIYRSLDRNGRLRGVRSGTLRGVSLIEVPDEEFYTLVEKISEKKGVNFPLEWEFIAHSGTNRDKDKGDMTPRSLNLFILESLSKFLVKSSRIYPDAVDAFLEHELGHISDRISGEIRQEADLPGGAEFLEFFIAQMDNPDVGGEEAIDYWDHQQEVLDNLDAIREDGADSAFFVHPMGAGKTVTAVTDAVRFVKATGGKILYLAHTLDIIEHAKSEFSRFGKEYMEFPENGGLTPGEALRQSDVFVTTWQRMIRHLKKFPKNAFDYIIIDESHHIAASSYQEIMNYFNAMFLLGMTGTSVRSDGTDVSIFFDEIADRKTVREMVAADILSPVRALRVKTRVKTGLIETAGEDFDPGKLEKTINTRQRNQAVVDTYKNLVPKVVQIAAEAGKDKDVVSSVVFCVTIQHAKDMAERFRVNGVPAAFVHGNMPKNDIDRILDDYNSGKIHVIASCMLLAEGWDAPRTEIVLMARPTRSQVLYLQQMGRGLRKHAGKDALWVIDFVDNMERMQTPCTLHREFGISEYRPGEYVFGEGPGTEIDLAGLDFARPEAIDQFDPVSWYSHSEAARKLEVLPEKFKEYIEAGFFKGSYAKVSFKNKKGKKNTRYYFSPADMEKVDKIIGSLTEEEIAESRYGADRERCLAILNSPVSDSSDLLGLSYVMSRLDGHSNRHKVHYRDEEVLKGIIGKLDTLHGVDRFMADMLLKVKGPVVVRLLKEAYEGPESSIELKLYAAAILALKRVAVEEWRHVLKEGLHHKEFYLSYLSALALAEMIRKYRIRGDDAAGILEDIKSEIRNCPVEFSPEFLVEKRLFALGAERSYPSSEIYRLQYLVLALAKYYKKMDFFLEFAPLFHKMVPIFEGLPDNINAFDEGGFEREVVIGLRKIWSSDGRFEECGNSKEFIERALELSNSGDPGAASGRPGITHDKFNPRLADMLQKGRGTTIFASGMEVSDNNNDGRNEEKYRALNQAINDSLPEHLPVPFVYANSKRPFLSGWINLRNLIRGKPVLGTKELSDMALPNIPDKLEIVLVDTVPSNKGALYYNRKKGKEAVIQVAHAGRGKDADDSTLTVYLDKHFVDDHLKRNDIIIQLISEEMAEEIARRNGYDARFVHNNLIASGRHAELYDEYRKYYKDIFGRAKVNFLYDTSRSFAVHGQNIASGKAEGPEWKARTLKINKNRVFNAGKKRYSLRKHKDILSLGNEQNIVLIKKGDEYIRIEVWNGEKDRILWKVDLERDGRPSKVPADKLDYSLHEVLKAQGQLSGDMATLEKTAGPRDREVEFLGIVYDGIDAYRERLAASGLGKDLPIIFRRRFSPVRGNRVMENTAIYALVDGEEILLNTVILGPDGAPEGIAPNTEDRYAVLELLYAQWDTVAVPVRENVIQAGKGIQIDITSFMELLGLKNKDVDEVVAIRRRGSDKRTKCIQLWRKKDNPVFSSATQAKPLVQIDLDKDGSISGIDDQAKRYHLLKLAQEQGKEDSGASEAVWKAGSSVGQVSLGIISLASIKPYYRYIKRAGFNDVVRLKFSVNGSDMSDGIPRGGRIDIEAEGSDGRTTDLHTLDLDGKGLLSGVNMETDGRRRVCIMKVLEEQGNPIVLFPSDLGVVPGYRGSGYTFKDYINKRGKFINLDDACITSRALDDGRSYIEVRRKTADADLGSGEVVDSIEIGADGMPSGLEIEGKASSFSFFDVLMAQNDHKVAFERIAYRSTYDVAFDGLVFTGMRTYMSYLEKAGLKGLKQLKIRKHKTRVSVHAVLGDKEIKVGEVGLNKHGEPSGAEMRKGKGRGRRMYSLAKVMMEQGQPAEIFLRVNKDGEPRTSSYDYTYRFGNYLMFRGLKPEDIRVIRYIGKSNDPRIEIRKRCKEPGTWFNDDELLDTIKTNNRSFPASADEGSRMFDVLKVLNEQGSVPEDVYERFLGRKKRASSRKRFETLSKKSGRGVKRKNARIILRIDPAMYENIKKMDAWTRGKVVDASRSIKKVERGDVRGEYIVTWDLDKVKEYESHVVLLVLLDLYRLKDLHAAYHSFRVNGQKATLSYGVELKHGDSLEIKRAEQDPRAQDRGGRIPLVTWMLERAGISLRHQAWIEQVVFWSMSILISHVQGAGMLSSATIPWIAFWALHFLRDGLPEGEEAKEFTLLALINAVSVLATLQVPVLGVIPFFLSTFIHDQMNLPRPRFFRNLGIAMAAVNEARSGDVPEEKGGRITGAESSGSAAGNIEATGELSEKEEIEYIETPVKGKTMDFFRSSGVSEKALNTHYINELLCELNDSLPINESTRVLGVGSGAHLFHEMYTTLKGAKVDIFDPDEGSVKMGKNLLLDAIKTLVPEKGSAIAGLMEENVNVISGQSLGEAPALKGSKYDIVFLLNVMDYSPVFKTDRAGSIAEDVIEMMEEDGLIVFSALMANRQRAVIDLLKGAANKRGMELILHRDRVMLGIKGMRESGKIFKLVRKNKVPDLPWKGSYEGFFRGIGIYGEEIDLVWINGAMIEVMDALPIDETTNVLGVGAGGSSFIELCAILKGARVDLVDPNTRVLRGGYEVFKDAVGEFYPDREAFRRWLEEKSKLLGGAKVEDMACDENFYDIVFLRAVLDAPRVMKYSVAEKVIRVLKPGGRIVFTKFMEVPNLGVTAENILEEVANDEGYELVVERDDLNFEKFPYDSKVTIYRIEKKELSDVKKDISIMDEEPGPAQNELSGQCEQAVAELLDTVVRRALLSGVSTDGAAEPIMIALDKAFIKKLGLAQQGLLNGVWTVFSRRLQAKLRKADIGNVIIAEGDGSGLAVDIQRKAKEHNVKAENIYILADETTVSKGALDAYKSSLQEKKAFIAVVDFSVLIAERKNLSPNREHYSYLVEMVDLALKMGGSEIPGPENDDIDAVPHKSGIPRMFVFIPKAKAYDFGDLVAGYNAQVRKLNLSA